MECLANVTDTNNQCKLVQTTVFNKQHTTTITLWMHLMSDISFTDKKKDALYMEILSFEFIYCTQVLQIHAIF